MAILTLTTDTDFSGQTLSDITEVKFSFNALNPDAFVLASFASPQFAGAVPQIQPTLTFRGNLFQTENINVGGGSIDASGWQFIAWSATNTITLNGSALADTITGTSQKDTINGGDGNDTFLYRSGATPIADTINGGNGLSDAIRISTANPLIDFRLAAIANVETLTFDVNNAAAVIFAGSQISSRQVKRIEGHAGLDSIEISNSKATDLTGVLFAGWETALDRIRIGGTLGADTHVGSNRRDIFFGIAGNDTIAGGGDADRFSFVNSVGVGFAGALDGGAAIDTLEIVGCDISFALNSLTGIERMELSGATSNDVVLFGSQISAAAGDIRLVKGELDGIADSLTVVGTSVNLTGVVFEDWQAGNTILISGFTTEANTLTGSSQNDTITGGLDDDLMRGGLGADAFFGQDGIGVDTVSYSLSGAVTVNLKTNTASGSHAEGDTFTGIENLTGSGFSDTLTGTDSGNTINGGAGNDTITGGLGGDTLLGGDGNDTFFFAGGQDLTGTETIRGGAGLADKLLLGFGSAVSDDFRDDSILDVEQIVFADGASVIGSIFASAQVGSGARAIGLVRGSTAENRLEIAGSSSIDISTVSFVAWSANDSVTLTGTSSGDRIIGSAVADAIRGFGGRDILTGSGGQDRFIFSNSNDSPTGALRDVITDFTFVAAAGSTFTDRIDFNFIGFSNGVDQLTLGFVGTSAFSAAGQVRAVQSGANTLLQVNIDGSSGAEMEIVLQNVTANQLSAADFIL